MNDSAGALNFFQIGLPLHIAVCRAKDSSAILAVNYFSAASKNDSFLKSIIFKTYPLLASSLETPLVVYGIINRPTLLMLKSVR